MNKINRKNRRILAAVMALFMILSTVYSGNIKMNRVSYADGEEQNLQDFARSVTFDLPESDTSGVYNYKTGSKYNFKISFTEIASGDKQQFEQDRYTFYYTLPAGLSAADFSGNESPLITQTAYGDVTFNNCSYTISGGVLKLVINFDNVTQTNDPSTNLTPEQAKNLFDSTENIHFGLDFDATIISGTTEINFGGDIAPIQLIEDTSKNIDISKSASSFNPQTGEVTYTLTVKSDGENSNVAINDTFGSSAFTIDQSSISVSSNMNSSKTIGNQTVSGNTLSGTLDLANNETVTITYKANYNGSLSSTSGDDKYIYFGSSEDTNNTFTVTPSDDTTTVNNTTETTDDNAGVSVEVKYPKISKSVSGNGLDEATLTDTATWTIIIESYPGNSLSGKTIKDVFGDNFDTATFDASNFKITRQQFNYDNEYYKPSVGDEETLSNTSLASSSNGWSFTVPEETRTTGDECYKYIITYTTPIDASSKDSNYTINNTVSTNRSDEDTTSIGYDITMPKEAGSSKSVEYIGDNKTRWTITLDIPISGIVSDSDVYVEDTLPSLSQYWDNANNTWVYLSEPYVDSIVDGVSGISVTYSEKIEGEASAVSLTDTGFKVVFTKTEDSTVKPGFAANTAGKRRSVTISYVTELNSDWLNLMNVRTDISDLRNHKNTEAFKVDDKTYTYDATYTANYTVEKSINKSFIEGNSANKSQGTTGTYDNGGNQIDDLPYFRFEIELEGIDDSSFDNNGILIITDSFDENLDYYNTSYWEAGFGGVESWGGVNTRITPIVETDDSGTAVFKINKSDIPKNSGAYYSKYRLIYFLRIKDKASLSNIAQKAIQSIDKKAVLENTATVTGFGSDSASFDFSYDAVSKTSTGYSSSQRDATFTVVLNPDAIDMDQDKDVLDVTDTYSSNLSIDFNSIKAYIDDVLDAPEPNNQVHYYASGNVLRLTVPDGKKIKITYDAKVIGYGDLYLSNTASFCNQDENWNQAVTYNQGSSSGGSQANINVFKYEDGDMTVPLKGVIFSLYKKSDDSFIKSFTTGDDGKFTIYNTDGISFDTTYYLKETGGTPDGYTPSDVNWTFTIVENPEDVDYTFGVWKYYVGDTMTVANEKSSMSIPVQKIWNGTAGNEAKFELYKVVNNEEVKVGGVATLVLNADNSWKGSFDNIPRRDDSGTTINYVVKEVDVPEGYVSDGGKRVDGTSASRIDKGVLFTNTEKTNGTLSITKNVIDPSGENSDSVYTVTVKAQGETTTIDPSDVIISGAVSYSVAADTDKKEIVFNFKKNDTVVISGLPYDTYSVSENDGEYTTKYTVGTGLKSDTASVTLDSDNSSEVVTVENSYGSATGSLTIKKSFAAGSASGVHKDSYYVTVKNGNDYYDAEGNNKGTVKTEIEVPADETGITISNLPFGSYTIDEVKSGNNSAEVDNYSLSSTIKVDDVTTSTATISAEDTSDTVEIINKYTRLTGDLIVTKTVSSSISSDKTVKEFNFTVTIKDGEDKTDKSINGTYGTGVNAMNFVDGEATFTLKDSEEKVATGLPMGVNYEVVETPDADFTTTSSGATGTISSTASTAAFTNTRATGSLTIKKAFATDSDTSAHKTIYYLTVKKNGEYYDAEGNSKGTNITEIAVPAGDTGVTINNLPLGEYTISEVTTGTNSAEVTNYDLTTTIKVGDSVTSTVNLTTDNNTADVVVTNKYTRQTGSLKVEKEVNSVVAEDATKKFTFTITMKNGSADATDVDGDYAAVDSKNVITNVSFDKGVANVELVHGQSVTISGLPKGYGYIVSENVPDYFTATASELSGTIGDTLSSVKITNTRDKGSVKITKSFSGIDINKVPATFQITNSYNDTVFSIDGRTGTVGPSTLNISSTGVMSYEWTINDVPAGITVTFTESNYDVEGYSLLINNVISTVQNSNQATTGTVLKGEQATATLKNDYSDILGSLTIKKDFAQNSAGEAHKQAYVVTVKNSADHYISADGNDLGTTLTDGAKITVPVGDEGKTISNLPLDKYTVEEVAESATVQYYNLDTSYTDSDTVTLTASDKDKTVTVINKYTRKTADLTVVKAFDGIDNLPDTFKITVLNNGNKYELTVADAVNKDEQDAGKSTNPYRWVVEDLPVATAVTVTESGFAVDGYKLKVNDDEVGSTATSVEMIINSLPDNDTAKAEFTNEYKIKTRDVLVDKRDITTGDELEGAIITIYEGDVSDAENPADELKIESWTSSDEAPHKIEGLEYGKTYTLRENTAPVGYDVTADTVFKINMDGTIEILGTGTIDNETGEEIIVINDGLMKTDIELCKVSEQDPTKKLPDSTYVLYRVRGTAKVEIARAVTDERGIIRFKDVEAGGEYMITEVEAPDGYYVSEKSIRIRVEVVRNGDGGVNVVLKSVDMGDGSNGKSTAYIDTVTGAVTWLEPEIICSVLKVDEDGKTLAGASLEIRKGSADGEVIDSWTSTGEAHVVKDGVLVCGETYYLVEKEAPEGYDKAEPVKFTIEETMAAGEDKTVEVVMIDKKTEEEKTSEDTTEVTTETTTEITTETTTEATTEATKETATETVTETTTTVTVTETNTENTDTVVKTSDDTPVSNMFVLIFVSLAGIVFFGSKKRKNNMS